MGRGVLLSMVHLVQSLHGRANLSAGHLLIEGVDKAVGARAILPRDKKRMETRGQAVSLSEERKAFRHAQLGRKKKNKGRV